MNLHKNARTTPHSRLLMVRRVLDQKQPASRVAADFGVSERTVRKWLARWRAGGEPALNDRSSAPARQRRLAPERVAAIAARRRQRLTSPMIARSLGLWHDHAEPRWSISAAER
jgi:transposase-like protein